MERDVVYRDETKTYGSVMTRAEAFLMYFCINVLQVLCRFAKFYSKYAAWIGQI